MKRIVLFMMVASIFIFNLFSEREILNSYDWEYTGSGAGVVDGSGGKERNFLIYFNLADTDRNDLYCKIGFSQIPFIKGSDIKGYDGNNLQMTWKDWGASETVTLTASTYAYWHVVVEGAHTLSLELTPSTDASVVCKYNQFTDETKGESKTLNATAETKDTLVSFTKIGRHYGSTLVEIEATVNTFNFTDDVLCTMTLILETST